MIKSSLRLFSFVSKPCLKREITCVITYIVPSVCHVGHCLSHRFFFLSRFFLCSCYLLFFVALSSHRRSFCLCVFDAIVTFVLAFSQPHPTFVSLARLFFCFSCVQHVATLPLLSVFAAQTSHSWLCLVTEAKTSDSQGNYITAQNHLSSRFSRDENLVSRDESLVPSPENQSSVHFVIYCKVLCSAALRGLASLDSLRLNYG